MNRLYKQPDDFEAVVRILTEREGGRRLPPMNGIRWDLRYFFQDDDQRSMVWPEFIDDAGDMLPLNKPISGFVKARFYVVMDVMRDFHRQHAVPGASFFCVEGKVCAAGVVARVTGLLVQNS